MKRLIIGILSLGLLFASILGAGSKLRGGRSRGDSEAALWV